MEEVETSGVNYENACRLCLSTTEDTQPIFLSGSEEQTGSPLLAEKIQECVSVEINESDGLSTQICLKCKKNVNNWHIFKRLCNYSQTKLGGWANGDTTEDGEIKDELSQDEKDDIVIDASYPEVQLLEKEAETKLQPEGPPILASLGLAPKNEKENGEEESEEKAVAKLAENTVRKPLKKSIMRPFRPMPPAHQMNSKTCLICGRTYRYSHNARRHELVSHGYDRYSNKSKPFTKLRVNPLNPKTRYLNPINQRVITIGSKTIPPKSNKGEPFPVRIRSLVDLKRNSREPEILKSLLTRKPELVITTPEIMRSGSASPETLISEPELAAYHVETIISEPDTYMNNSDMSDEGEGEEEPVDQNSEGGESEEESEMMSNPDVDRIIGVNGEVKDVKLNVRRGSVEHIIPDSHNSQAGQLSPDEGADPDDTYDGIDDKQDDERSDDENIAADEQMDEYNDEAVPDEGETYNEIDVDEHEVQEEQDNFDEEDDNLPPVALAPIVEINEGNQPDNDDDNVIHEENDDGEEGDDPENPQDLEDKEELREPPPLTITTAQKAFILKYRDVIEQINTLRCKCCGRAHPRRKALIQHLQKNGSKVPKHTCYNCIYTFTHIGALLSHMRANVCTDLWRIIYEEGGIPDEMVVEGSALPAAKVPESNGEGVLNKSQYKDILNARSYACKLCMAKFQLKQMIMKHIIDVHENGGQRIPQCCIHCKYRFKDNKVWKKHIRNGECTVYIACEMCTEKFRSMTQFTEHAMTVHIDGYVDQSSESISKSVDGRPTDCHLCGKTHSSYHNLVKHLKTVHNEEQPHMCQHCDSKFAQVTDLNHHIYTVHSERTNGERGDVDLSIVKQEEVTTYNYSCTDCDAIFDSVDGWTQHQIDAHNHTAYECDLCDKKYLQDSELAEHKNEHLKVRFYSCTLCSNSYNSAQSLSEHMMECHPGEGGGGANSENPFFCEMCQRGFKNRQAFSNHMRIHSNIPTFNKKSSDGIVIKKFSKFQKLQKLQGLPYGMIQRNSPKSLASAPYSCDICGKGFLHKKNIWKHKKVLHPDEAKRIELEKTGTHFLNSSLDLHTSQNSDSTGLSIPQFDGFTTAVFEQPAQVEYRQPPGMDDKPVYQCDLCDKKFSVKSSIWKHKRVKHGIVNPHLQYEGAETKISCNICKINFSDKKSYLRHKKSVHSVSCKICGIALNSTLELYEHYKAVHAKELLGYNASQGSGMEESREGSDEGEEGGEEEENPEEKYQARYPCGECGRTFVGMTALQEHDCQDPSQSQTFDCEICDKSYTSIAALKSHRGWHLRSPDGKAAFSSSGLWMPPKQPTGKISKFEVKTSTPVVDHLEIKKKLPPDVQMTLVKKRKLNDQVTMELIQPKFDFSEAKKFVIDENRTCEPCGKQFSSKAGYMRHMDEVHKPNSIFCPICNKSFTRKSTLLVHMRKHGIMTEGTGSGDSGGEGTPSLVREVEKLYACDMCNVGYTTSKSLKRHRLKHHMLGDHLSETRPTPASIVGTRVVEVGGPSRHKCGQCGETFPTEKELRNHTHFSCEECPMVFSRQQYLSAHVRSRHQEAVSGQFFPCSLCDRFYMNKKSLQRHIETSH